MPSTPSTSSLLNAARRIMELIDEHGLGDDDRQVEFPVAAFRAALEERMTTYIAIQFGYWGRGATEAEALDNMRKSGGRYRGKNRERTLIYSVSHHPAEDKPWVDDYGMMCWHGDRELVAEIIKGTRLPAATAYTIS